MFLTERQLRLLFKAVLYESDKFERDTRLFVEPLEGTGDDLFFPGMYFKIGDAQSLVDKMDSSLCDGSTGFGQEAELVIKNVLSNIKGHDPLGSLNAAESESLGGKNFNFADLISKVEGSDDLSMNLEEDGTLVVDNVFFTVKATTTNKNPFTAVPIKPDPLLNSSSTLGMCEQIIDAWSINSGEPHEKVKKLKLKLGGIGLGFYKYDKNSNRSLDSLTNDDQEHVSSALNDSRIVVYFCNPESHNAEYYRSATKINIENLSPGLLRKEEIILANNKPVTLEKYYLIGIKNLLEILKENLESTLNSLDAFATDTLLDKARENEEDVIDPILYSYSKETEKFRANTDAAGKQLSFRVDDSEFGGKEIKAYNEERGKIFESTDRTTVTRGTPTYSLRLFKYNDNLRSFKGDQDEQYQQYLLGFFEKEGKLQKGLEAYKKQFLNSDESYKKAKKDFEEAKYSYEAAVAIYKKAKTTRQSLENDLKAFIREIKSSDEYKNLKTGKTIYLSEKTKSEKEAVDTAERNEGNKLNDKKNKDSIRSQRLEEFNEIKKQLASQFDSQEKELINLKDEYSKEGAEKLIGKLIALPSTDKKSLEETSTSVSPLTYSIRMIDNLIGSVTSSNNSNVLASKIIFERIFSSLISSYPDLYKDTRLTDYVKNIDTNVFEIDYNEESRVKQGNISGQIFALDESGSVLYPHTGQANSTKHFQKVFKTDHKTIHLLCENVKPPDIYLQRLIDRNNMVVSPDIINNIRRGAGIDDEIKEIKEILKSYYISIRDNQKYASLKAQIDELLISGKKETPIYQIISLMKKNSHELTVIDKNTYDIMKALVSIQNIKTTKNLDSEKVNAITSQIAISIISRKFGQEVNIEDLKEKISKLLIENVFLEKQFLKGTDTYPVIRLTFDIFMNLILDLRFKATDELLALVYSEIEVEEVENIDVNAFESKSKDIISNYQDNHNLIIEKFKLIMTTDIAQYKDEEEEEDPADQQKELVVTTETKDYAGILAKLLYKSAK